MKLPQLQNYIKRDSAAYRDEFLMQKRHFDSELEIFKLRPSSNSDRFTELVTFMSHVVSCYPSECEVVVQQLLSLLELNAMTLHPAVRYKLMQALIILRKRSAVDPLVLIKLSFKMFVVQDKEFRELLSNYIFQDIKAINIKKNNDRLNRSVQAMLFDVVEAEESAMMAKKSVEILSELYTRRIWTDERTVNVLAKACLSKSTSVSIRAMYFFLGIDSKMMALEEEEASESNAAASSRINNHQHSKKTKKRKNDVKQQEAAQIKARRDYANKVSLIVPLFPAIQLIHNPQHIIEKLFATKLRSSGERFEIKLVVMNFMSRLIGCHSLILLPFYSFLEKYIHSHQNNVTNILAYMVQSCHEQVPPEVIYPIIKTVAHNFVTERNNNETIAVGINCIREVISRVPSVLREGETDGDSEPEEEDEEEDGEGGKKLTRKQRKQKNKKHLHNTKNRMGDLIQDLAMYSKKTHKSVMMASNSLVNLIRQLYPVLLKRSDQGRNVDKTSKPGQYGHIDVSEGVEGIELLDAYERGEIVLDSENEVRWVEDGPAEEEDGWEEAEDDAEEDAEGEEQWESVSDAGSDDAEEDAEGEEQWESVSDAGSDDAKEDAEGEEQWESVSDAGSDDSEGEEMSEDGSEGDDDSQSGSEGQWEDGADFNSDAEGEDEGPTTAAEVMAYPYNSEEDDNDEPPRLVTFPDNFETKTEESHSDVTSESEDDSEVEEEEEVEQKIGHKRKRVGSGDEDKHVIIPKKAGIEHRPDAKKLLTSEDFALLAKLKAAYNERLQDPKKRKLINRANIVQYMNDVDSDEEDCKGVGASYTITPENLAPAVRARKEDKIEKLSRLVAGRKESKWEHEGHAGGLTNLEKKRTKNFMMVRKGKRSVVKKTNISNSDTRWEKMHHREQMGREKRKRRRT